MDDNSKFPPPTSQQGERPKPIVLISQLLGQIANLRHVDEAFLWLCRIMVQYQGISAIQIWAPQLDAQGNAHLIMRADASHSFPPSHPIYINKQIEIVVQRFLREELSTLSMPLEQVFPPPLVKSFREYKIHFLSDYFLRYPAFLPAPRNPSPIVYIPSPLTLIVTFFSSQPLSKEQTRDIHFLLGQSMRVLVARQFLLQAPTSSPTPASSNTRSGSSAISLESIIPHRADNMESEQAANPFSTASAIGDKRARRFYSSIDGKQSVAAIAIQQGLTPKDVRVILHFLLQQEKIRLHTPTGEPLDHALFIHLG